MGSEMCIRDRYCHISNSSKRKVLAALTEDRSMTSIAREQNISVNTVPRVLESCLLNFTMSDCLNTCFSINLGAFEKNTPYELSSTIILAF